MFLLSDEVKGLDLRLNVLSNMICSDLFQSLLTIHKMSSHYAGMDSGSMATSPDFSDSQDDAYDDPQYDFKADVNFVARSIPQTESFRVERSQGDERGDKAQFASTGKLVLLQL